MPAPDTGALADHPVAQGPATAAAGLALAPVDRQLLLEVTRRAIGVDVVAQGRAAARDGLAQDRSDRIGESRIAPTRDGSSLAQRRDTRGEQRFGGIDVAHPDHDALVHEETLDRRGATAAA